MRKVAASSFWCLIVSFAVLGLGLIFILVYAASTSVIPGECSQYEQVQFLDAFRSDFIVIVLLGSLGGAFVYWLLTKEQAFFGHNGARMLFSVGLAWLLGRPLFLLLLSRGVPCLQQALSQPTNLPVSRVSLFGQILNNLFLSTSADQVAAAMVFVMGAYLARRFYLSVSASRLWQSS
jgi:hypothetical protein